MDSSEPNPKKIKVDDECNIKLQKMCKRLICHKLQLSMMEEILKKINPLIDNHNIKSNIPIDPKLQMQLEVNEAKEAFIRSNLERIIKYKESLLTVELKQVIDDSISEITVEYQKN